MEKLTGFVMKNSLTLPSLANKYFNSWRDENDEPIYTNTDPFMRHFIKKALRVADVWLSANIINQPFHIKFLILCHKN